MLLQNVYVIAVNQVHVGDNTYLMRIAISARHSVSTTNIVDIELVIITGSYIS